MAKGVFVCVLGSRIVDIDDYPSLRDIMGGPVEAVRCGEDVMFYRLIESDAVNDRGSAAAAAMSGGAVSSVMGPIAVFGCLPSDPETYDGEEYDVPDYAIVAIEKATGRAVLNVDL
jgi:hypothetical protein